MLAAPEQHELCSYFPLQYPPLCGDNYTRCRWIPLPVPASAGESCEYKAYSLGALGALTKHSSGSCAGIWILAHTSFPS